MADENKSEPRIKETTSNTGPDTGKGTGATDRSQKPVEPVQPQDTDRSLTTTEHEEIDPLADEKIATESVLTGAGHRIGPGLRRALAWDSQIGDKDHEITLSENWKYTDPEHESDSYF
jgi:hypothetical protein